jgi:hypothetical protein
MGGYWEGLEAVPIVLARRIDNLYILDNPARNVKISLIFQPLNTSRRRSGKDAP